MSNGSSTPSPDARPATGAATGGTPPTSPVPPVPPVPPAPPPKPGLWRRIKRLFLWWIGGLLLAVALWTL